MPPEDAKNQPNPEERQVFLEWITSMKYLSPKAPAAEA